MKTFTKGEIVFDYLLRVVEIVYDDGIDTNCIVKQVGINASPDMQSGYDEPRNHLYRTYREAKLCNLAMEIADLERKTAHLKSQQQEWMKEPQEVSDSF